MKLYKLTEQDGSTRNKTYWEVGSTHSKQPKNNPQLCSADVFHAYTDVNLAFLLNPIHANIKNPILWECRGDVAVSDWGKVGCFELTTKKQINYPKWVNSEHEKDIRILFAILCAESVLSVFENQYPNDNRPRKAIEASKKYLQNKNQNTAAYAADAADAAHAAAYAAYAAHAADAAEAAAEAAAYAADAAHAVAYAAYAAHVADAAHAAEAAEAARTDIDFVSLAQQAINTYMK